MEEGMLKRNNRWVEINKIWHFKGSKLIRNDRRYYSKRNSDSLK
jgi:hypothetical protein